MFARIMAVSRSRSIGMPWSRGKDRSHRVQLKVQGAETIPPPQAGRHRYPSVARFTTDLESLADL